MAKTPKVYLVITRNTAEICDTWERAWDIMRATCGQKFHKKFDSEEEAKEYARSKMKDILTALEWGMNPYRV